MLHADLSNRLDAIERLMAERLHLRAKGGLPGLLRAAKGRLPRKALRQARELVDVRAMLESPAATSAIDPGRVNETIDMLERHLTAIPEGKYKRRARSSLWGGIAVQLLLVVILVIAVLRWRGLA